VSRQAKGPSNPAKRWRVWWLNPAIAFSVPAAIAGLTAYYTDTSGYQNFWRTPKYFDLSSLGLLLGVVIIFVLGCVIGAGRRVDGGHDSSTDWTLGIRWQSVRLLFRLSFILTMMAYGIWFAVGIQHGLRLGLIYDLIRGASGATYYLHDEYLPTIPGVTTATQFGLAVIALGVPLGAATGWRGVRWQCLTVFTLALVRAFINSERLAVIELLVPFVVSFVWLRPPTGRRARRLTQAAPVLGPVFLYVFFGAAEYFRSWSAFYANRESSFWTFIGLRLMGYYTTALNNGALLWRVRNPLALGLAPMTLEFLGHFPILGDVLRFLFPYVFSSVMISAARYDALLTTSANRELNNPSGIFAPFVDYGLTAGLLYWLLCGSICGCLYKEFKLRTAAGIFLYPMLYIGLIEATRLLYWADGRFFPPMFLLVISSLFVLPKRRRTLRDPGMAAGNKTARLSRSSGGSVTPLGQQDSP
jgi:hypothetical protein